MGSDNANAMLYLLPFVLAIWIAFMVIVVFIPWMIRKTIEYYKAEKEDRDG